MPQPRAGSSHRTTALLRLRCRRRQVCVRQVRCRSVLYARMPGCRLEGAAQARVRCFQDARGGAEIRRRRLRRLRHRRACRENAAVRLPVCYPELAYCWQRLRLLAIGHLARCAEPAHGIAAHRLRRTPSRAGAPLASSLPRFRPPFPNLRPEGPCERLVQYAPVQCLTPSLHPLAVGA